MTYTTRSLNEWLSIAEQLSSFSIRYNLDHVQEVATQLDLVDFDAQVIMVGGTNGKGSLVRLLEWGLLSLGYQVGTYTSPHFFIFNERIKVNNNLVDDASLCDSFEKIYPYAQAHCFTYFEFTTLVALDFFKKQKLDYLVLEIGLGGRLDAVNVVNADLSIITSIDYDHMEYLGPTLQDIAREKSGIFKFGKKAICAMSQPPSVVFEQAFIKHCQLYVLNEHYKYVERDDSWNWYSRTNQWKYLKKPRLHLNAAAAFLMALEVLALDKKILARDISEWFLRAKLFGRFTYLNKPFPTILDVAHNPQAAKWLATQISSIAPVSVVFSALSDKNIDEMISIVNPYVHEWYCAPIVHPRGITLDSLKHYFQNANIQNVKFYSNLNDAYNHAVFEASQYTKSKFILAFGSFHVVSSIANQEAYLSNNLFTIPQKSMV